ncbi:MAG: four-carbon acid sugar kinase family protein, partial [Chloroflexota bacterium]|nr:four-carbon acid sugar kinase family protein [Chloroflexota bacterium]
MEGKLLAKQFAIIADDLTGAMDTGVSFARIGLDTIITFGNEIPSEAAAVVVSTDSRADSPEMAYRKTAKEASKLAGLYV